MLIDEVKFALEICCAIKNVFRIKIINSEITRLDGLKLEMNFMYKHIVHLIIIWTTLSGYFRHRSRSKLTRSNSLLGSFWPRKRSIRPCPNFCRPENVQSAASCVPSKTSGSSPCIRILKYAGDGSAPEKSKNYLQLLASSTLAPLTRSNWVRRVFVFGQVI